MNDRLYYLYDAGGESEMQGAVDGLTSVDDTLGVSTE